MNIFENHFKEIENLVLKNKSHLNLNIRFEHVGVLMLSFVARQRKDDRFGVVSCPFSF